jgi:heme exporter protein A
MPNPKLPPDAFAARGLACRRGERMVFTGLDFDLSTGGALLLTGANGSGKSSLLRLMAGLTPPESGLLAWDGAAIGEDRAAHRARLHYVGHADALKPHLTVAETVAFWAAMRGERLSADALDRFRLGALADFPCRILSAGQRRRVALARLAASHAPLWLLDEPTTGLDSDAVADLTRLVAEHRAEGGRVALATHAPLALDGAQTVALGDYAARWAIA